MIGKQRFRFIVAIALLALAAAATLWRYAELAFSGPPAVAGARPVVERGPIFDRNGAPLAINVDKYNLACWKPEMPPEAFAEIAPSLAAAASCGEDELTARYREALSDFVYLKKALPASVGEAIRVWIAERGVRGIVLESLTGRLYPERRLASHALGFVNTDARGVAGIELGFDEELMPYSTIGLREDESTGSYVGSSVWLSLDANVQYDFERIAREGMESSGAEAVMLFAIDVRTGELYAYASMPDFDPNDIKAEGSSLWNRPATYAYEPGSVFKVFTMATLLESGAIDAGSRFVCDGAYEREVGANEPISIKCMGVHGEVDVRRILEYSCNAGAAYASDRIASLDFETGLRAFGFGTPTGIGLRDETAGLLAPSSRWSARSKPTIAFGQEVLVSALQVLQAACVVGNGGSLVRPTLVSRVVRADGTVERDARPVEVRRVLSPGTCALVLESMELASRDGSTGWRAAVGDVRMAVKTGTAQMIDPETRAYSPDDFIASCLAIFPVEAPRYAVYAVVVKPRGDSIQGGRVAAPLVKAASDALLFDLGASRGSVAEVTHPGTVRLIAPEGVAVGERMPDLTGVPKRALLPLLRREDLEVTISGEGYVVRQSPAPGTPVVAGMKILLELE
jgi:cell division protein FtsI (penicillin-binding protein 3)